MRDNGCFLQHDNRPRSPTADRATERGVPRRTFLRLALAGVAATGVGSRLASPGRRRAAASSARSPYALVIDTTRCRGDGACVEACRLQNGLPEGVSYLRLARKETGDRASFLPLQCQHCADAPCARVCPTNATRVRPDGVVVVNTRLCVGCKYCMTACPYQARVFDETSGVVDKCWLCLDRVQAGREPACVSACVFEARLFGRTDDSSSRVSQLIASGRARPLHPEFETRPAILKYVVEE